MLLTTAENDFPLLITVENTFLLVITVQNTLPTYNCREHILTI